jgi:hypothetical protein
MCDAAADLYGSPEAFTAASTASPFPGLSRQGSVQIDLCSRDAPLSFHIRATWTGSSPNTVTTLNVSLATGRSGRLSYQWRG